jgi:peptidyl-prolyl cis-trans isomerase C
MKVRFFASLVLPKTAASATRDIMNSYLQRFLMLICALAFLGLQGCSVSDPKDPRFVVAKGNGVEVTRGELNDDINMLLASQRLSVDKFPKEKLGLLESQEAKRLVVKKLLLNESKGVDLKNPQAQADEKLKELTTRFPSEASFKAELEKQGLNVDQLRQKMVEQITIQETLENRVPAPPATSVTEVQKFYDENENRFKRADTVVRASHILVMVPAGTSPAEKEAKHKLIEAARDRVLKGEDFAKVAQEVSEDRSTGPHGGDLDFFPKNVMVPEFDKVAFNTKVGVVSPVFETAYGYHFLKVTDTKPPGKIPLSEIQDKIAKYLGEMKRQQEASDYLKTLESKASVKYNIPMDLPTAPVAAAPSGVPASTTVAPAATAPTAAAPAPQHKPVSPIVNTKTKPQAQ